MKAFSFFVYSCREVPAYVPNVALKIYLRHSRVLELSTSEKVEQILWIILKVIGVFVVIFAFICSLALLTDAFKLIGGQGIGIFSRSFPDSIIRRGLGRAVRNNRFIQNPISASIIGNSRE